MSSTEGHALTAEVSEFVAGTTFDAIPEDVRRLAKRSILDGLGLAVLGSCSPAAQIAAAHVSSLGINVGSCTVLGSTQRTAPRFAAFLNGIAIHADDFDDTQLAESPAKVYGLLTHPTAPVLPAVLAWGEASEGSGRDLIAAYSVGVETECKLAEAISPRHYREGFHTTGTMGALGSAAALANFRRLDPRTVATALSIAASQSAGLRESFGSMTKPLHAGRASEAGMLAVDLACSGFTSASNILEADRGLFRAFGGSFEPEVVHDRLGAPWSLASPGVSIKPYPSGSLTHPAMCALRDVLEKAHVTADMIEQIRVGTNSDMPTALIHHRPSTELQAKFSMEFCLAIVALEGDVGVEHFQDSVVVSPRVQEMLERVQFVVDPRADADGGNTMASYLRIDLSDGRRLEATANFGKGSPEFPMSEDELLRKFIRCATARTQADPERLTGVAERVREWEHFSVCEVLEDLAGQVV